MAEPSFVPGYVDVRLFLTAVRLEGAVIPVADKGAFVIRASGKKVAAPYIAGYFGRTDFPVAVALVVQTGYEYRDDLEAIRTQLVDLLKTLPDGALVTVVSYGEVVDGGRRLGPPSRSIPVLEALEPDLAPSDSLLIDACERALTTLRRYKPKDGIVPRKLMIVVSDGIDVDPEPERYRSLGKRAASKKVRIDTMAYSPVDNRRPLLGLGELSKRSGGTFRWIRDKNGFAGQFRTLKASIEQQYVVSVLMREGEVAGKRFRVEFAGAESDDVRVKEVTCGSTKCEAGQWCAAGKCMTRGEGGGRGILFWVLVIGGGVVGLLVVLGLIGFAMSRQGHGVPMPPPGTAPPQAGPAPGGHRIVAYDGQGNRIGGGAPQAAAGPGGQPGLLAIRGPVTGRTFPLAHGMTIGSQPGCHILLPGDPKIAPVHAQILLDQSGGVSIVDQNSPTGVFVNGVRVHTILLRPGMLVKIGGAELRFVVQ